MAVPEDLMLRLNGRRNMIDCPRQTHEQLIVDSLWLSVFKLYKYQMNIQSVYFSE